MRSLFVVVAVGVALLCATVAVAEDPFAAGDDALAVKESDGSSSVRARMKIKKAGPEMVMVKVKAVDDSKWPDCVVTGQVLRAAKSKKKHFKLMGRGKVYKFKPVYKKRGRKVNYKDKMSRNNLGACYYPKNTKLEIKVSGVDLKSKTFTGAEIYLK